MNQRNSIRNVGAGMVLVAMSGCGYAEPPLNSAQIDAFMDRYEAALATEIFSNVQPLVHPQATFRFSEGDFVGLSSIKGAFEKTWAIDAQNVRYFLSNVKIVNMDTDSATVLFNWNWSGQSPQGESFEVIGRGTSQVVRVDGELKLLVEHLSR